MPAGKQRQETLSKRASWLRPALLILAPNQVRTVELRLSWVWVPGVVILAESLVPPLLVRLRTPKLYVEVVPANGIAT